MERIDAGLLRNVRLIYTINFLSYLYFNDAIYIFFGVKYLHLDYVHAGSLFFVGWFASIAFDFLGGIVADGIGRKKAQLIGTTIQIVAFTPYLLTKNYGLIVTGSFFWGIGQALSSNTLSALVYEQAREHSALKYYQRLTATSQTWLFLALASAALIGGALFKIDPRLPYACMMVAFAASLIATALVRVPPKVELEAAQKTSRQHVMREAVQTFRANPRLTWFIFIGFLAGIAGDILFSYFQPFFLDLSVSSVTIGLVYAILRTVSGLGSYLMRTLPDRYNFQAVQLFMIATIVVTAGLMYVLTLPLILLAPIAVAIGFGFIMPNMRLFVNSQAKDSSRAAALSFATGIINLGVGIGFVLTYIMADHFSHHFVLRVIIIGAIGVGLLAYVGDSVLARKAKVGN